MKFRCHSTSDSQAIVQLFTSAFAEADGQTEGELIGGLAKNLLEKTEECDLFNFVAEDDGRIAGSIFFSRLDFESGIEAFILSPVAVHSDYQSKGIGQALILHGLAELKERGVRIVLTYGDPVFYRKVGFCRISDKIIKPPFELTQAEGWLGQSLVGEPIGSVSGRITCVPALSDAVYW